MEYRTLMLEYQFQDIFWQECEKLATNDTLHLEICNRNFKVKYV